MKNLERKPIVFFNASVILAGLKSPNGGSAKLLNWVKENKIIGIISEIVIEEVLKNTNKIFLTKEKALKLISQIFLIVKSPNKKYFSVFKDIVLDEGDIHLLVSAKNVKANFLVSLDKKHILSLKNKIKDFKIVLPKELIEFLRFN
jgi:putative PIN family toxin of toxin-antitoxin system